MLTMFAHCDDFSIFFEFNIYDAQDLESLTEGSFMPLRM